MRAWIVRKFFPKHVYLVEMGAGPDKYVSVVFFSHKKAIAHRDRVRSNPRIVCNLDCVSVSDADGPGVQ